MSASSETSSIRSSRFMADSKQQSPPKPLNNSIKADKEEKATENFVPLKDRILIMKDSGMGNSNLFNS